MSGDIGWPTPGGNVLNLTTGSDFTWSFQLRDANANPVNFPAGEAFLQFPDVDDASYGGLSPSSGSVWKWTIYGSVATMTVPSGVADLIPDETPWYFVWIPEAQARFDAAGSGYAGAGSPSWAHTITGSAVVVFCNVFATSPTVTATCGGVSMTQLATVSSYTASAHLFAFGLINPPTGAKTIALTCDVAHEIAANSLSYVNVGSFDSAVTAASPGNLGMQVLTPGNKMVAQAFSGYASSLSNYNQMQRSYFPWIQGSNLSLVMGDAPVQDIDHQPALSFSAINSTTYSASWAGIAIPMIPTSVPRLSGYTTSSGSVVRS